MGDVIDLEERRPGLWVVAHAICLDCRHTWIAVANLDDKVHMCRLDCSKCDKPSGIGIIVPTRAPAEPKP